MKRSLKITELNRDVSNTQLTCTCNMVKTVNYLSVVSFAKIRNIHQE